jgi:Flp pilus assembly protein TadG
MTRHSRRGSHAIEFALTLPLFVALVMAIFEFGWMFFMRSTVIHAVRDGCRAGAVIPFGDSPSPTEVAQARMTDFLAGYSIDCRGATDRCGIDVGTSGETPYETMNCSLTIAYDPIIGLIPHPDRLGANSVIMFEIQQ